MDIAVMTMVHKEVAFLQQWIMHYEPLVGRQNLYILTHDGDEDVVRTAHGCRLIYLPRNKVDWKFDRLRFRLLNAYADFLLNNYDCVISGDVDELVFADPAIGSIFDLIEENKENSIMTAFGMHLCEQPEDPSYNPDQPVLSQRTIAVADDQYCKPHIAFKEPKWTKGFHGSAHKPNLVDGLYMAHLKYAFKELSKDVSSLRKETFDQFDNIGNKSLRRFWGQSDMLTVRKYRELRGLEAVNLDECIHSLRDDLRSNVTSNYAKRGGLSLIFTAPPQNSIILPERFRDIPSVTQ